MDRVPGRAWVEMNQRVGQRTKRDKRSVLSLSLAPFTLVSCLTPSPSSPHSLLYTDPHPHQLQPFIILFFLFHLFSSPPQLPTAAVPLTDLYSYPLTSPQTSSPGYPGPSSLTPQDKVPDQLGQTSRWRVNRVSWSFLKEKMQVRGAIGKWR